MEEQKPEPQQEVVKFERRGLATIFGAPISWVALFGALIGVTSLVPMIFYIFGGGFISMGMAIFGPIAGIVLGPWAGLVAGLIGGLIGMFVSPASYPLGLVDVFLSGAFIPLFWGLVNARYRKIFIPWWLLWIVVCIVFPYHVPGEAGGWSTAAEPQYILSWSWTYIGFILYLIVATRFLPAWLKEGAPAHLMFIGLLIFYFLGNTSWMLPWKIIYFAILKYPWDVVAADNVISWWAYTAPMVIAGAIVGQVTIVAMRRGGLRRVEAGIV